MYGHSYSSLKPQTFEADACPPFDYYWHLSYNRRSNNAEKV